MMPELPAYLKQEPSAILCPQCLRQSVYWFMFDQYECPVGHGTVITGEELASYFREVRG
jgi:hypothetical protein